MKDDLEDFRRQCERQLRRPVIDRIRFGFFRNPDPVRDAGVNRSFASMAEYRAFCERSYPAHFGYQRASGEESEAEMDALKEFLKVSGASKRVPGQ